MLVSGRMGSRPECPGQHRGCGSEAMSAVKVSRRWMLMALAAGAIAPAPARGQQNAGPYVPTPWRIVDEMLRLAAVVPADFVMDLGSGDGRLVIAAAERFG